jgi:hypothetical protein
MTSHASHQSVLDDLNPQHHARAFAAFCEFADAAEAKVA